MNKYTKEFLEPLVKNSSSWREVCDRVGGIKLITGMQAYLKKVAVKFEIDFSHFPGQAHKKNLGRYKPIKDLLKKNTWLNSTSVRIRLIKEGLKDNLCANCGIFEWLGEEAPLELDHIDSDHLNNELDNLQILCANCHMLKTRKHSASKKKVKKKPKKKKIPCPDCTKMMNFSSKRCLDCSIIAKRNTFTEKGYPTKEELAVLVLTVPITQLAKTYNVSDNSVRHWCKIFNIELPHKRGNWTKKGKKV